jgi:hypothetical protein
VPEVIVQIEPNVAPVANHTDATVRRIHVVAADAVSFGARIAAFPLAQVFEHGARKPMDVAIENSHRLSLPELGCVPTLYDKLNLGRV